MKSIPWSARRVLVGVSLAVVYALPFLTISGTGGVYLKIPDIDGEAVDDENHKGWIELSAVQFGLKRQGDPVSGATSKPEFQEVTVTKELDKASPKLMLACASGKVFPKVEIDVTRSTQAGETLYMKLTLTDVLVTSLSHNSRTDEQRVVSSSEGMGMTYTTIKWEYTPIDDSGKTGETISETVDRREFEQRDPQP